MGAVVEVVYECVDRLKKERLRLLDIDEMVIGSDGTYLTPEEQMFYELEGAVFFWQDDEHVAIFSKHIKSIRVLE